MSVNTTELGQMSLLDIIGSQIRVAPSDLTWSDLERSKSKPFIVYHKGDELGSK